MRHEHVGYYVVAAYNGVGRTREQRGYLNLNTTTTRVRKIVGRLNSQVEQPFFATLAAMLLVIVGAGRFISKIPEDFSMNSNMNQLNQFERTNLLDY